MPNVFIYTSLLSPSRTSPPLKTSKGGAVSGVLVVTRPHPPPPELSHSAMLPRPSQRSIFHLGEEGVDDHRRSADEHRRSADEHVVKNTDDTTRILAGRRDHGRQRRNRDTAVEAVGVGLQILVQSRHHTRAPPHSHIVLKQVVVLPTKVSRQRHRRGPGISFLRVCCRCRRELSSSKDVYMYRGDQGFCSEECRCEQILADEATEREAMIKKEKERMRRGLTHHLHHGPRSAMAAISGASRRLVAIAY